MIELDSTHDPALQSWVTNANNHPDFPIQNLPLGVFAPLNGERRAGVAIGDHILDLAACAVHGLLAGDALRAAQAAQGGTLNALLALGARPRRALRLALVGILARGSAAEPQAEALLHDAGACTLHLPALIGDYTDFYAGLHHAMAVGKLFRPDAPLLPNYKYVPIGYHGRASSVVPSGVPFRRPSGQRKPAGQAEPDFGPCRNLDYELELGIWIGPGNEPGAPIPIGSACEHIAGFCLLNDWSARDVQAWEYQPLGPFLGKSFATTISPWIVTPEALAPFRIAQAARPEGDPRPLPYLWDDADQQAGALNLVLEVLLLTPRMREAGDEPHRLSRGNARDAYWTVSQLVAHHSSNGCNLRPGDLFGSGTLSGPTPDSLGSLLELTESGRKPLALPNGETRRFLEDGDEILFRARAEAPGAASIGFGSCRAVVLPN
ncbi:MAG: fumarylacetoacetase [Rhodospirillales bacterium]